MRFLRRFLFARTTRPRLMGRWPAEDARGGLSARRNVLPVAAIGLALFVLLGLTTWGSIKDFRSWEQELLVDEIRGVRSQAVRTAGRIEQALVSNSDVTLESLREKIDLASVRELMEDQSRGYAYAAIVNPEGLITWHTNPGQEGEKLGREWYENVAYDLGSDVVRTRDKTLTAGMTAFDVHVPIIHRGSDVATFHIGLSQDWFRAWAAGENRKFLLRQFLWVGSIFLLVTVAAGSLYLLLRRIRLLRESVTRTYMRGASELGRLAAGLAHEIRNPLHALRLNLHAFRRTQQDREALEPAEVSRMLDQSSGEIARVENLLQQLIDFTTPAEPREIVFNLNSELEGVVDFISQELRRSQVEVGLILPDVPISVRMDPARLRQIMLNLLHNARDSMPEGGRIEVQLIPNAGTVEIVVSDQGSGIAEADLPHIFEPFFTTSDDGTGLGLALVRRFVEEAGGDIVCEANQPHGTRFHVWLSEVTRT